MRGTSVSRGASPSSVSVVIPAAYKPNDLVAADVGDAGQVVVLVPPSLAELAELADGAVLDRVGLGRRPVVDGVEEPLADAPVIGEEVERASPTRSRTISPSYASS